MESLASTGRSCDRHDLRLLASQLYARLLLLDVAVLMREIPGLAVRRDDNRLREQDDVDVLLAACDVRTRTALDIAENEVYAEVRRCAKRT